MPNQKNPLKPFLLDLDYLSVLNFITASGEQPYRARQIWEGIYKQYGFDLTELKTLPAGLRIELAENFSFSHLQPAQSIQSSDGMTIKTLFRLSDGSAIEAVLMRYGDTGHGKNRRTLCISTQAGCAMGCVFCATGQMGFTRNLSSGEIVEQVLYYSKYLQKDGEKVTNIVFMGMGEPFHNYEAVMEAIDRLSDPQGYNFGARRFTISTVGIIPGIRRFADEQRQVNLAVSLHSVQDDLRTSLLPVNRRYPVTALIDACHYYSDKTRRRITFEWALIEGVNDSVDQARILADRLVGLLCHVNVIPLNPTQGYDGKATPHQRALDFQYQLHQRGIPCTVRLRRGIDIQAGCGQLAIQSTIKEQSNPLPIPEDQRNQ